MSIYENGPKPKASASRKNKLPSQKADTKQIVNDKDLTALVKQIKKGPQSAKELLYDSEKNVVGVLQRNGVPFFLSQSQIKELQQLQVKD